MFRRTLDRLVQLPEPVLYLLLFAAVALAHLDLLRLPYYWDEGGYYIPAALDFYHRWTLIPQFTNGHPPLPNVVLGLLWHVVGFHILATRLCAAAFASAGLLAVFRIGKTLLNRRAAAALTLLTAVYPIWFAQSTLAHADIFAAAFTLWSFAAYFILLRECHASLDSRVEGRNEPALYPATRLVTLALLFSLAALSKETAIVEPAALAALEVVLLWRDRRLTQLRRNHLRLLSALSFPVLPLIGWYIYHRSKTGFIFGNPEYLRYNATANFTAAHVELALRYRFIHLFLQRDIWIPILLALACLLMPRRFEEWGLERADTLRPLEVNVLGILIVANWLAFSVLGGALLTRYLLPVYPLILLLCVFLWREHTRLWPVLAVFSAAFFVSAWWINPPVSFAPEDNLTYRDMIMVHEDAVHYLDQHYPDASVLTAWPVAADLVRPELGYTKHRYRVKAVENFSLPELLKAAQDPGSFDTAVVFTTHYMSPALERYLEHHPNSARAERIKDRDLTPQEVAALLGGRIVWQESRDGESAAILRFNRAYDAELLPAFPSAVHLGADQEVLSVALPSGLR